MKKLMKGNEAIAEAAIQGGCKFFFGYPITPQNEIPEYMSRRMPQVGGLFLQAESEVSAINMVYGAGGAGGRVMTSSSSPGISLKQEGISYLVGAQVPCVIVNIVRGGPGLGGIQPAQSDYYQATRGGGHGDYRTCVLAPSSVQEAVDLTKTAFDIADRYRNPVMVLGDGMIGQMMEPVDMDNGYTPATDLPAKDWAADGHVPTEDRPRSIINSLYIDPKKLEEHCMMLEAKYAMITENECRWQEEMLDDAEIVIVAYGTTSRIARSAMRKCRQEGIKVGLLRPITLWPFPTKALQKLVPQTKHFLTVEMSTGQMVDDVRLAVDGKKPVHFMGHTGGIVPTVSELVDEIKKYAAMPQRKMVFGLDITLDAIDDQLKSVSDTVKKVLKETGKRIDETVKSGIGNKKAAPDATQQKEEQKLFDDSSFDAIEAKLKDAMSKMKDKLKEASEKIDDTSSKDVEEKVRKAAETMTERVKAAAYKMEQMIEDAGLKQSDPSLDEIEKDLDKAAAEMDQAFEDAAKAMEQSAEEAAAELDQAVEDAGDEADEISLDDIKEKLESAAKTVEQKLNEAGKKIDAVLNDPKMQQKAEDAGKHLDDFLDRTGKTIASGIDSFAKIVTRAANNMKKDLQDNQNNNDAPQDKEEE